MESKFPDNILFEILLRLPVKSVLRCRSTCKSWNSLTSDPVFLYAHARRAPPALLIQPEDNPPSMAFDFHIVAPYRYDGKTKARVSFRKYPSSRARYGGFFPLHFVASCDGLVCFLDDRWAQYGCYHVYNPATEDRTIAPIAPQYRGFLLGFYFHRATEEYRLMHLSMKRVEFGWIYEVEVITLGSSIWRSIELCFEIDLFAFIDLGVARDFISVQGCLHWPPKMRGEDCCIWVFDKDSEKFRKMGLPQQLQRQQQKCHLIEMAGSLALCQVSSAEKMDVWVLKEYRKEETWIKQFTISFEGIPGWPGGQEMRWFKPLASWKGEEILMCSSRGTGNWCGYVIYNFRLNTLKKVRAKELNGRSTVHVVYKETLLSNDYFKKKILPSTSLSL